LVILLAAILAHSIREVDFRNFTYRLWSGSHEVRAVNGQSHLQTDADPADPTIEHIDVAYGDLTGDGREEAVVIVGTRGGGTGYFTEGFIYTLSGIRSAWIEHGTLVVKRNHSSSCQVCTDAVITTRYRLAGRRLRVISHNRRKISE